MAIAPRQPPGEAVAQIELVRRYRIRFGRRPARGGAHRLRSGAAVAPRPDHRVRRLQGRAPATRAETRTVDYIVSQFREAGLQPGGDLVGGKRQWTQAVPLLKSDIAGTPQIILDLGNGQRLDLAQGDLITVRSPTNGQAAVNLADAPLVFVGYGVRAPERQWDDFKGVDLRARSLVVLINDPDFESGDGDFGGKAMTYYGRWTYKYEEAARQGAAGVLIVHETAPASYGWATVKNSNTNTMFDIVRDNPAAEHPPLEGWIQRDLAVRSVQARRAWISTR